MAVADREIGFLCGGEQETPPPADGMLLPSEHTRIIIYTNGTTKEEPTAMIPGTSDWWTRFGSSLDQRTVED